MGSEAMTMLLPLSEPVVHSVVFAKENVIDEDHPPMERLAPEMRFEIWTQLVQNQDWLGLCTASQVNHRWKREIEYVWRVYCEKNNLLADEKEWLMKGRNWKWLSQCRKTMLNGKDGFGWCEGAVPGTLYEGDWGNNKRHGVGRFVWQNNDRYIGDWHDDFKHGHGLMLWMNGDRYDGDWQHDLRHGSATYTYANGGKYVGQYMNDERHGQGTFYWPDGEHFMGTWKTGGRHGSGVLVLKDGTKIKQNWNESPSANYSRQLPPKLEEAMSE